MVKSITTEEFINRAKEIHGDKYDYSKVEYVNAYTKVCIICKKHGEFWVTPHNHLNRRGCAKCASERLSIKNRMGFLDFVEKAKKIHGLKYIYEPLKNDYINNRTKICITCPEHGEFWQTPYNHLKGKGCPKCGRNAIQVKNTKAFTQFLKDAKNIHGNKYEYDENSYTNSISKMRITCKVHGDFWQTPHDHLSGTGCPICAGNQALTTETFIEKANEAHDHKYSYEKIYYVNNSTKICITCPEHGDFWQTPNNHLRGCGCPKCGIEKIRHLKRLTFEDFKRKGNEVHDGKYIYNDDNYIDTCTKIKITCPIHGDFWQTPDNHLQGCGCPKCGYTSSKGENEINDYISNKCLMQTVTRDKKLLGERLECDIIVPSHKLAIEFDGLIWHSEKFGKDKNYHLHKTKLAESKGYHLIHIFEDEWLEHKELVLNKIRHILGCDSNKPVVGARKCVIKMIPKTLAEPFLTTYHIQGFVASTVYYGAYYKDALVAVMSFKQEKANMWNLTRFATNTDYRLPGLASKIFKQFIKDSNPIEVKTFLDRRWSHCNENVYDRMGFKLVEVLPPDYRYVVKNQRLHKFGFRKQILAKKYGLPLTMTEKEMAQQLGFYRIWDCGLYKYIWEK